VNRLGLLLVATLAACGVRERPYRFASPMLGHASVPPVPLPGDARPPPELANRAPHGVRAAPIRIATAPRIREASAAAAAAIATETPVAREETRAQLPAPHRIAVTEPLPTTHLPADLRALVGRRDARDPVAATAALARDLGLAIEATTGTELVAWAEHAGRLAGPTQPAERGDLLVFDGAVSDDPADLVGIVIARDERNVTEFLYLGNGVIRRGFVDASRPNVKRDEAGAVVNTFLRTGRRWPPRGTRYLAGELLAHVIRAR
jgi:hypothetical protein